MKKFFFTVLIALTVSFPWGAALAARHDVGAVYTMTNAESGNEILVFNRAETGGLTAAGSFDTAGTGTGTGLGNQSALVLSDDGKWLFAVNAGSDTISVFRVQEDGLELAETVDSGGKRPISIAANRDLLYVLNTDGSREDDDDSNDDGDDDDSSDDDRDNITGFRVGEDGNLTPIPDSTRFLSAAAADPAQVGFTPDGEVLVVTEKATNTISTFTVEADGVPGSSQTFDSAGPTPFGFAFVGPGQLLVSEAFGGEEDASALSSYTVSENGELEAVSSSVPSTETAACWVVVTLDNKFAYTANTGSDSISGYEIAGDGSIVLRDEDGRTGETGPGSAPIDMALSEDGRFLYVLNSGAGTIAGFHIRDNGQLRSPLPAVGDLPAGANGLAAR